MSTGVKGKRILVVEDDYFIAADVRRMLEQAGAIVLGPVHDTAAALVLAGHGPVEVALLDVNLDGVLSYELADALTARGVPCLFLTGYDDWSMPAPYRAMPRLAKPFTAQAVMATIARLLPDEATPPAPPAAAPRDDGAYFRQRAQEERDRAREAQDQAVALVHLDFAERYEQQATQPGVPGGW